MSFKQLIRQDNVQLIDIHYKMGAYPLFQSLHVTFISGLCAMVGANGCGKSTLLRMMSGLLAPEHGKIMMETKDLYANLPTLSSQIGYVATKPFLYPHLTIQENLIFIARLHNLAQKGLNHHLQQVVMQCNIQDYQNVLFEHCSDGVKKRAMIASALIHQPKLLILDEPCAELDPHQRQLLWTLLLNLRNQGKNIIFSSHHPQEFSHLCDAIYHLEQGQLHVLTHHGKMTQMAWHVNQDNPETTLIKESKI